MVTTATLGETRTVLENISWQTFKTMLVEMGSERKNRIAYDDIVMAHLAASDAESALFDRLYMVLPRSAAPTICFVDEYCKA